MSVETDLMTRARLFEAAIFVFPDYESPCSVSREGQERATPLRHPKGARGVRATAKRLVFRRGHFYLPAETGQRSCLGRAIKGGHNAENHNHNDVGSFVVALGKSTPLLDPGSEVYTARTFGPKRYESNVLNSFGHPVPRVASTLQVTGREAQAKILKTQFTDAEDTLVMDISSAYKVPGLKKLERTFVFSREGEGKLTITDEVEFDQPQTFGTALITFSKWRQAAADRLVIGEAKDAVEAIIEQQAGNLYQGRRNQGRSARQKDIPIRLGIELTKPVRKASVTVTISAEIAVSGWWLVVSSPGETKAVSKSVQ